eukprot:5507952-Amphidinium_carterae.1
MDMSVPLDYVFSVRNQMQESLVDSRYRGASRDRQHLFQIYSSIVFYTRDDVVGMEKFLEEEHERGL